MIILKNKTDLEAAVSQNMLTPLFASGKIEKAVLDTIENNIALLTENYGDEGEGGYIAVITDPIDDVLGRDEYLAEFEKYHLAPDDYELEERLGTAGKCEVLMELFVMTEFNVVIIFRKKVAS